jgi:hypothetical protein
MKTFGFHDAPIVYLGIEIVHPSSSSLLCHQNSKNKSTPQTIIVFPNIPNIISNIILFQSQDPPSPSLSSLIVLIVSCHHPSSSLIPCLDPCHL